MAEQWHIDEPQVIDVDGDHERITKIVVAIVGGHVDLVSHTANPDSTNGSSSDRQGARIEVSSVHGLPLEVTRNGSTLRVMHGKLDDATGSTIIDMLRRRAGSGTVPTAVVSVAIPAQAKAHVNTLCASVVASGLTQGLSVNTVSGELTVNDVRPKLSLNTVSGAAECVGIGGALRLNSVSGDVTVHGSSLDRARINTVTGDVALDLTDSRVRVRSSSVSGDVTVRAPLTGYAVTAHVLSGQVVVDGTSVDAPDNAGPKTPRQARAGDESLALDARSVSGSLVVLRADSPTEQPDSAETPQDARPEDLPRSTGTPQDAVDPGPGADGQQDQA